MPVSRRELERCLAQVYEGQMLQFTADGFRLYEYVETGETEMQAVKIGPDEYYYRMPPKEPLLQKSGAKLSDLFDVEADRRRHGREKDFATVIDDEEFKSWLGGLLAPEDIRRAAMAAHASGGNETTTSCSNCEGEVQNIDCPCTEGGVVFADLSGESENPVSRLREKGVPDPDCGACAGQGKFSSSCPVCSGRGKVAKYPRIILRNELTNEERVLNLDLTALVASKEMKVEWGGYEIRHADGRQLSQKIMRFKVLDYIASNIAAMGMDIESSAIVSQGGIRKARPERIDIEAGALSYWQKDEQGRIKSGLMRQQQEAMSSSEVLEAAQKQLAKRFARPYGKIRDEHGMVVAEKWVMRPLRPFEDALEDLKAAAVGGGYTLGFTHSFIATEEAGPSFFLLDSEGNPLTQLSSDYYLREALENAWLNFPELRDALQFSGE